MFNQKVNGYLSENPEYLNYSYSSPNINPIDTHNCATTINKYTKSNNCSNLPLQTWCSPNVASESFAMRPIVNSREYFESINKYLSSIIYTDSVKLKNSKLANESYSLYTDYGYEPESSFIETIKYDVTNQLSYYMSASSQQVSIFKEFNPICEGFVITDIDIKLYRSNNNPNHFFHKILFSAFNTTRYNTISFSAHIYQDTTPIMNIWNNDINKILTSHNTPAPNNLTTNIYVALITLMNNVKDSECEFKGYNLSSQFSQLLNEKPSDLYWKQPNVITQNVYNTDGNYDQDGNIRIVDYGPDNLEQLIKKLI